MPSDVISPAKSRVISPRDAKVLRPGVVSPSKGGLLAPKHKVTFLDQHAQHDGVVDSMIILSPSKRRNHAKVAGEQDEDGNSSLGLDVSSDVKQLLDDLMDVDIPEIPEGTKVSVETFKVDFDDVADGYLNPGIIPDVVLEDMDTTAGESSSDPEVASEGRIGGIRYFRRRVVFRASPSDNNDRRNDDDNKENDGAHNESKTKRSKSTKAVRKSTGKTSTASKSVSKKK